MVKLDHSVRSYIRHARQRAIHDDYVRFQRMLDTELLQRHHGLDWSILERVYLGEQHKLLWLACRNIVKKFYGRMPKKLGHQSKLPVNIVERAEFLRKKFHLDLPHSI